MNKFPPGSEQAAARGCICPIADNRAGKGAYADADGQVVYWFSKECRMHGMDEPVHPDTLLMPMNDSHEVALS